MSDIKPKWSDFVKLAEWQEIVEIRIRAGTKGERELYRREFGIRLFGDPDPFSKKAYTLEPLRVDGPGGAERGGLRGSGATGAARSRSGLPCSEMRKMVYWRR